MCQSRGPGCVSVERTGVCVSREDWRYVSVERTGVCVSRKDRVCVS